MVPNSILKEGEDSKMKYVLTVDGNAITQPMTLKEIIERFGDVLKLESSGVTLRAVKERAGAK